MVHTRIWLINSFRGDNHKKIKAKVVLLACDAPTWPDICSYQLLSNYLKHMGVIACRRFWLQGTKAHNEEVRVVSVASNTPTVLIFTSNKYYQNISNHYVDMKCTIIWLINSFRGDKPKKTRVVLLAIDTPTWPDIWFCQIISNYLKQYGSYSHGQDFGFRGDKYISKKVRGLSFRRHVYWSSLSLLPNIIKIPLRVSKLWSTQGCV